VSFSDLAFVEVPERADDVVSLFYFRKLPEEDSCSFCLTLRKLSIDLQRKREGINFEPGVLFLFLRSQILLLWENPLSSFLPFSIVLFVPVQQ
jgi:hypothetical protein